MGRTLEILEQCKEWAIQNNLHLGDEKTQLKKIAEELTEAFVHLELSQSVDDDIGDILIAVNTLLLIRSKTSGGYDGVVKQYVEAICSAWSDDTRVKFSRDEWRNFCFLPSIDFLYNRQACPMVYVIEAAMQLIHYYADNRGSIPATFIEASYDEIKNRKYSNQFAKD